MLCMYVCLYTALLLNYLHGLSLIQLSNVSLCRSSALHMYGPAERFEYLADGPRLEGSMRPANSTKVPVVVLSPRANVASVPQIHLAVNAFHAVLPKMNFKVFGKTPRA